MIEIVNSAERLDNEIKKNEVVPKELIRNFYELVTGYDAEEKDC
jgi:hypothetical protein